MPFAPYGSSPLDRKSLGQRLLSTLVPQLQSFRFQASQAPRPAPVPAPAPGPRVGGGTGPIGRVNPLRGPQVARTQPVRQPLRTNPASPAPNRLGATQPTVPPAGLSPALATPPPTSTSKMDAEAGQGGEKGFDMQAFLRYLALLGQGSAGGNAGGLGTGGIDTAAGSQAGTGGGMGNFG